MEVVKLIAKLIVPLALVLGGCAGMNDPTSDSPEDDYRDGFAAACEASGHDDRFDCHETAYRMIGPQGNLGGENENEVPDAYALGYTEACDEFFHSCPLRDYTHYRRVLER